MKKSCLFPVFVFACLVNVINAQVTRGGFGNLFVSPVYNFSPALQNKLGSENLIGTGIQLNTVAFTYGGAGHTLRRRGFILGGVGNTYHLSSAGANGNARLNVSAGFFTIGHLVLNKEKWIAFPYGGVGAFGSNFTITNTSEGKTWGFGTDSILPGKQAKYSAGGMAFAMGFDLRFFALNKKNKKGKDVKGMIGLDAGMSFLPAFEKWENVANHTSLNSMNTPFQAAAYLRVTIGFGVFYETKN